MDSDAALKRSESTTRSVGQSVRIPSSGNQGDLRNSRSSCDSEQGYSEDSSEPRRTGKLPVTSRQPSPSQGERTDTSASDTSDRRADTLSLLEPSPPSKSRFSFTQMFITSHKQKNNDVHKLFSVVPETEKLIDDYSCALQRDILIHGRLYVTQSWLCFYANIFSWETLLTIPVQTVCNITKEKTALLIPNAIQIHATNDEKYGFSSLMNRDVTYAVIKMVWDNTRSPQPMTPFDMVKKARELVGDVTDIGTADDLWGPMEPLKKAVKQNSLPTYLEINAIPSMNGTVPTYASNNRQPSIRQEITETDGEQQIPAELASTTSTIKPLLSGPVPPGPSSSSGSTEVVDKTSVANAEGPPTEAGVAPAAAPNAEDVSLGDSAGSEYETVSFTDETGEVPCGCSEHLGRTVLNDVYNASVETMFQLLLTDSSFYREFMKARKAVNIEVGEWQPEGDGAKTREISYTLALNYSFGPKFSLCVERHRYSKQGQPGLKHIVDTEVCNGNIPYSDTFFVSCRFCLTRVAHNKTRFLATANINFKKKCWGMVQNLIERNVGDALRTHYTHLDQYLKEYLATLPTIPKKTHRSASRSRRHRAQPKEVTSSHPSQPTTPRSMSPTIHHRRVSREPGEEGVPAPAVSEATRVPSSPASPLPGRREPLPRVNMALTLLLAVLILFNVVLYYHLTAYHFLPPTSQPPAKPKVEWSQSSLHREVTELQVIKWKSLIEELGKSLQQVEVIITHMKNTLEKHLELSDSSSPTCSGESCQPEQ